MSQSTTIMDARTQHAYLSNQIKRLINGEELSYDSLQLMLDTVEQLDKDAAPIYPEPEGDPSY